MTHEELKKAYEKIFMECLDTRKMLNKMMEDLSFPRCFYEPRPVVKKEESIWDGIW